MSSPDYSSQQEVSLRDILLGIGAYAREVWRKKWWVVLAALLMGAWFAWEAYRTPVRYTARMTFMLNQEEGGGNPLGGVLGNLGLGAGGAEFNMEKVIELSKSRLIVQEVLLDSAEVDGQSDLIANQLLDIYELPEYWRKNDMLAWAEVRFDSDDIDQFSRAEKKVLVNLQRLITQGANGESAIATLKADAGTSILTYRAYSLNEDLSYELLIRLYEQLSDFYIEKTTGGQRLTYNNLSQKADSLQTELTNAEYQLANRRDGSLGLNLRRDEVATGQLERKVLILNTMYSEVLRNLATAEFALGNATPFFALIDEPFMPLSRSKPAWTKRLGLGLFFGGFLAVIGIALLKLFRDNLRAESD